MSTLPSGVNQFAFVTIAALRAKQLMSGSTPRVAANAKHAVTARHEVAAGKIVGLWNAEPMDGAVVPPTDAG